MKCLIIGGNRFVGLRLSLLLEAVPGMELHILNRTGQAPHCRTAIVHKGDRRNLNSLHMDREWDYVYDFAGYTEADAQSSISFFKKVTNYFFISTMMVYDNGAALKEEQFPAETWDLKTATVAGLNPEAAYQDGKRRAEATFAQKAAFPVLSVRFPFILGPDDYTGRLEFHRERVLNGEPIFIPKLSARTSMVHSQDAAQFLLWARDKSLKGAMNVASSEPISMGDLISQVEVHSGGGKRAILTGGSENQTPYSNGSDLYMSVQRMEAAGFKTRPILAWLRELLFTPSGAVDGADDARSRLH